MVDVIFLDFAMPGLSGVEVTKRVKQVDPNVPVVIMTGYADSAALDEILGHATILRKPFSASVLLEAATPVSAFGRMPF
jgi:CheY-like chemotaxis protein